LTYFDLSESLGDPAMEQGKRILRPGIGCVADTESQQCQQVI
jgi:hypothetical protein